MAGETKKIQILGPLWSANATILETGEPNGNTALRTLFVANRPRNGQWPVLCGRNGAGVVCDDRRDHSSGQARLQVDDQQQPADPCNP